MKYSVLVQCEDGEPPVLKMVPNESGLYRKEDEAQLQELLHQWWVNSTGCDGALDYISRAFKANEVL